MTVTFAYYMQNNGIMLSEKYQDEREFASLDTLKHHLSLNPVLMNRPFLCNEGLVSSIHGGTVQYVGSIKKHTKPLWLASKDFRGTIDFFYSQVEWPFQIHFNPQGFLGDFVIERLINGFVVPLFTRQISKQQPYMSEAQKKYVWESREQVIKRVEGDLKLTAR